MSKKSRNVEAGKDGIGGDTNEKMKYCGGLVEIRSQDETAHLPQAAEETTT